MSDRERKIIYRAYKVNWSGLPETDVYVAAENVGCAKAYVMAQTLDADCPAHYTEMLGIRYDDLDDLAMACKNTTGLGWHDRASGEKWGCCEDRPQNG